MSHAPRLTGIVVHWHDEEHLGRLCRAWPDDPRFELLIVDNGSRGELAVGPGRVLAGAGNLGFAGGVNRGLEAARGELVLLLNPDAEPAAGALEELLAGFDAHPGAAGIAPRLEGEDGAPQHRWQLRPLPRPATLLAQTLLLPAGAGPRREPAAGALVEQPAAAALALRAKTLRRHGGLDPGFHPAWFEDVDLARRLHDAGETLRYWPAARFRHALGASVPRLGYGPFLWVYYKNLLRYVRKHHGRAWTLAAALTLIAGMKLRLLLLPIRRPRRSASRRRAAGALLAVIAGVLSGWRLPRRLAELFAAPTRAPSRAP